MINDYILKISQTNWTGTETSQVKPLPKRTLILGVKTSSDSLISVRSPKYAILGQTVQMYCNFTLPPGNSGFYSLKVTTVNLNLI